MAGPNQYPVEPERPLWVFVLVSLLIFSAAVALSALFQPPALPPVMEVDIAAVDALDKPPLAEPDAGASPTPAPTPQPTPEETPQPTPEPTPPPTPEPTPQQTPDFEKPEPTPTPTPPPKPTPTPHPVVKTTAKPVKNPKPAKPAAQQQASNTASNNPNAKVGPKGVSNGKAGGKGGGKGDLIFAPKPLYDHLAWERHYQGSGVYVIQYQKRSNCGRDCGFKRWKRLPRQDHDKLDSI
ncbi:MAG: hypothetical protein QM796_04415 [Chthoniobacteraceae bacterium]